MAITEVVHSTDLGNTLEVTNGKVELNGEAVYSAMRADDLHISVWNNDPTNPFLDYTTLNNGFATDHTQTFDDLKAKFEAAKLAFPEITRWAHQEGTVSWGLSKRNAGEWMIGTSWLHGGVGAVTEGYGTVVNDPTNPLFVKKDGTPVSALETISTYNLQAVRLMRMVVGAKATHKYIVPTRLRSAELVTDVKLSGYCQGSLKCTIEYADGSTVTERARPYNNNWYLGDILDQTKAVVALTVEVDAATLEEAGKFPTNYSRDFATGIEYNRSSPDYALGTPFHTYSYWYSYYHSNIGSRFHLPEAESIDITGDCTITSSIVAAAGFPVSNLTDGDATTAYKASTTASALTFTIQRNTLSAYVFRHVDISLQLEAGSEAQFASLSRLVVVTSRNLSTAGATSNTRDITGLDTSKVDANGNITIRVMAGSPNVYPDVTDKMTIALTKLVAGNFKVSGIRVFGHTPTAG